MTAIRHVSPAGEEEVEVLIVGAGPVGLMSAIQLGRAGIRTLVVERRDRLSRHPKAAGVHGRTMEIFRQFGIADAIRAAGASWNRIAFAWMIRLNSEELGSVSIGPDRPPQPWEVASPEPACGCGQDVYEPIMASAAAEYPSVAISLSTEAIAIDQDADGVTVTLRSGDGKERIVRAAYVIGADGVRSRARQCLGIGEQGVPAFGDSINIRFRADLDPFIRGRAYGLFWVINPEVQGAFMAGHDGEWGFNFEADPAIGRDAYDTDDYIRLIRAGIGAEIPVEIVSVFYWQHDQAVTDRWRDRRVFLAGDSAHRFPPHGGFGMNSGVQDSLNLIWKLVARLRWGAGDALLDTYEAERRPVALTNGEQCLLNTHRMQETGYLLTDTSGLAAIERPEGEAIRQRIRDAVPKQAEQYHSMGQQFGLIYESAAIVDDGTEPELSTVSHYRPTAHPGARLPHIWLETSDGARCSVLDLFDGRMLLLAGSEGAAWREAAGQYPEIIRAVVVGEHGDMRSAHPEQIFAEIYGISEQGAVLVRPDNHVAARFSDGAENPGEALANALHQILATA